ncbi:hypothetical protein CYLTODRAFT_423437 [Cylindrobasidium torrendii FP15055 ss-10]|uniref:Uncharacterized protein n=1 Tax=Cylindrobasidium torrendii FP15055 ss-10 TaxID=1314674 RepID=A0A0D7B8A2_9AGAR|nr:hypothetical protein CYLTODRAFT_423437 [Cylindrobasidium torrendii FP15055 ss-10]
MLHQSRICMRIFHPQARGISSHILRHASDEPPPPSPPQDPDDAVSDSEWTIRTGRAIDLLQKTLPEFFEHGLITSLDRTTGAPNRSSPIPIPVVKTDPLKSHPDLEPVYSPHIRLSYTPPTQLPAPFPKTLSVEGLPLYLASSAIVRHTLHALYSDLRLVLDKFAVEPAGAPATSSLNRERKLAVAYSVFGSARVSGSASQWTVHSTYIFSPITGLILEHRVNSILPAPHFTAYDGLREGLSTFFGSEKPPGQAVCRERVTRHSRARETTRE